MPPTAPEMELYKALLEGVPATENIRRAQYEHGSQAHVFFERAHPGWMKLQFLSERTLYTSHVQSSIVVHTAADVRKLVEATLRGERIVSLQETQAQKEDSSPLSHPNV